jgi:hypothetical protein
LEYRAKQKALFDAYPEVKAAWKLKVRKWNAGYRLKKKMEDMEGNDAAELLLSEQQNLFVDEYKRDAGENDNEMRGDMFEGAENQMIEEERKFEEVDDKDVIEEEVKDEGDDAESIETIETV